MTGSRVHNAPYRIDSDGGQINLTHSSLWYDITGAVTGAGTLRLTGSGALALSANNSYSGKIVVENAGGLYIGRNDIATGSIAGDIELFNGNSNVYFGRSANLTYAGAITGQGNLYKRAGNTLTLTGANNTYGGKTFVQDGTLVVTAASVGLGAADVGANGTLRFNQATNATFAGGMAGSGTVIKQGAGNLTLTGASTFSGATQVTAGTLTGAGSALGSGQITVSTNLVFNQGANGAYAGRVAGAGAVAKQGAGILTLAGNSGAFTGTTTVASGNLRVGDASGAGSLGGGVAVQAGATLSGSGTVGAAGRDVVIANNATLAPGNDIGNLTVAGHLLLSPNSQLAFEIGRENVDHVSVQGDLLLDGQLTLLPSPQAGDTPRFGQYQIMSYAGALNDQTLSLVDAPVVPGAVAALNVTPSTLGSGGTVNVMYLPTDVTALQYWKGGDGAWREMQADWYNSDNDVDLTIWGGKMAVFRDPVSGPPVAGGDVVLQAEGPATSVSAQRLQFIADGYRLAAGGDPLELIAAEPGERPEISVAPNVNATIAALVTGADGLVKAQGGTLILENDNTYSGGTVLAGGALRISRDENLGAAVTSADRTVTLSGGALQFHHIGGPSHTLARRLVVDRPSGLDLDVGASNSLILTETLNADADLAVTGTGRLILTNDAVFDAQGRLLVRNADGVQVGMGVAGSLSGDAVADTALYFGRADTVTYAGNVSGDGFVSQMGTGALVLTGVNTQRGGTRVIGGTVVVAEDASLGDPELGTLAMASLGTLRVAGTMGMSRPIEVVSSNGVVEIVDPAHVLTISGNISGAGDLFLQGAGKVVLAGDNASGTHSGRLVVANDGGLQLGDDGETGATDARILLTLPESTLTFLHREDHTHQGQIQGDGQVIKLGVNALTLDVPNTYTGGTVIRDGVLAITEDNRLGGVTSPLTFDGGALRVSDGVGALSASRAVAFVGDGGALDVEGAANILTLSQNLTGGGPLRKTGEGRLVLAGANGGHSGGVTVEAGVLTALDDAGLGAGALTLDGGVFQPDPMYTHSTHAVALGQAGGELRLLLPGQTFTLAAPITGEGGLTTSGDGTVVLAADSTYDGVTTVANAGGIRLGDGVGVAGSVAGGIDVQTTLVFDYGGDRTYVGDIAGGGQVRHESGATLTLTGFNGFEGGLTVASGRVIGAASSLGKGDIDIDNSATLEVHDEVGGTLAGSLNGTGDLVKSGTGALYLAGDSSAYTGHTDVQSGTLLVGHGGVGALGGALDVWNGATLGGGGGVGAVGLTTRVMDGGTLAPGNSIGQLSIMGDLLLDDGAKLHYELGTPGSSRALPGNSDHVYVHGDLRLAGAVTLESAEEFDPGEDPGDGEVAGVGYYRLFTYDGALTGPGLTIDPGSTVVGLDQYRILTDSGRYVDLYAYTDTLRHWSAGDGVWNASSYNWYASVDGDVPLQWSGKLAVFAHGPETGQGGVVTVDGVQQAEGMQFVRENYRLTGGTVNLSSPDGKPVEIRVLPSVSARIDTVLSGIHGINKTHFGDLTLTADNTYAGGTVLTGGVLRIDRDANLGAGQTGQDRTVTFHGGTLRYQNPAGAASQVLDRGFRMTGDGTLDLALPVAAGGEPSTLTVSGPIDGHGDLTISGAGRVVLTADGAHSGLTHIRNSGGVQVGDYGTAGRIGALVLNDTWLGFARADDVQYGGSLYGNGILAKLGSGALLLTGDSSAYGGSTQVQSGVLRVGAQGQGALGGAVDVFSGATLGGSGAVGSAGRNVTVHGGATLSPGNSVGTLRVGGDLVLHPGSVLEVEADDQGQADLVEVAGTATLGGVVRIEAQGAGFAARTPYTILSASQLAQAFSAATANYEYLTPELSYSGNAVTLTLVRKTDPDPGPGPGPGPGPNPQPDPNPDVPFEDAATTPNGVEVAKGVESLPQDHPLYQYVETLPEGTAETVFEALSGEAHASAQGAMASMIGQLGQHSAGQMRGNLGVSLGSSGAMGSMAGDGAGSGSGLGSGSGWGSGSGSASGAADGAGPDGGGRGGDGAGGAVDGDGKSGSDKAGGDSEGTGDDGGEEQSMLSRHDVHLWAEVIGGQQNLTGRDVASVRQRTSGVFVGGDARVGRDWRVGVAAGYTESRINAGDRGSRADVKSYSTTLTAGRAFGLARGQLNLIGGASHAWNDLNTRRDISSIGLNQLLKASYKGHATQVFGELGWAVPVARGVRVEPFAGVSWQQMQTDGYRESGGFAALSSASQRLSTTSATTGLRVQKRVDAGAYQGVLNAMLGWRHTFGDTQTVSRMAFEGGREFSVQGTPIARDAALVELGGALSLGKRSTLSVAYNGQLSKHAKEHTGRVNLRVRF